MRPALLLLLSSLAFASEVPKLSLPVERYRLDNGMVVVLYEDHRVPQVAVDILFRVGSRDEAKGRTGFAHLFEHLMFMGTRNVPNGGFDAIMEAAGGQNNATTSEDRTNYFEIGPATLLETFLWLEADRLMSLPDDMTKQKVDLQREVVKNERRQSYENRPYGAVDLVIPDKLFPLGHPYHHPVIGSHADLTAARVEDVKAFFKRFYVPSNASLVIAGDFDPAEAKRLVEKYFAWMPRVGRPAETVPPPAQMAKDVRVTLHDRVELPRLTLVWHSAAHMSPGEPAAEVLAALLGGGKSSRLTKSLVYDKRVASEVEVRQESLRTGGYLYMNVTAAPGVSAQALETALRAELKALESAPPALREVERARAFVETRVVERAENLVGLAELLNEHEWLLGDAGQLERVALARYSGVGAGDLTFAVRELIGKPHLTVITLPAEKKK
jgi:predicted Zn-dependent peptidase